MPTRNIVPNAPDEGKIGTDTKRWSEGNFSALKKGGKDVVVADDARLSDARVPAPSASDLEVTDATKGVILKSANGTRWRITIGDDGSLTRTPL